MSGDRLLGSYLLRVSVRGGSRSIALHSVLTGDAELFDDFASLAAHLDRATARSTGHTLSTEREDPGETRS
jgi:hypothetical protein